MSGIPAFIHRYEIEGRIGEGGMGALYLARDPILDRQVAIKVLREGFDNPDLRERFVREAKSAARLTHVNIVRIFDFGEHEGQPYIAMEYIPGETLADKIRRRAQLPLAERLRYMEDLCSGLAHAHKAQIVHRDIKPANVMISPEGELKILDFGIARVGESKMTQAGMLVGTLNYMSPEQLAGGQVDHRSDIFAVGALFYELLAYRQAFPGGLHDGLLHRILHAAPEPIEKFCPDLDPEVVRIILRAVEKDPTRRYQSLGDMERDVARVRDWLPSQATQIIATPDAATAAIPLPRPSDAGRPRSTPPIAAPSPGSAPGEPRQTPRPHPKAADPSDRTAPMPVAPRPPARPPATDPALLEAKRASEVRALLESAQKALDDGRYAEAIGAAEAALLRTPDQPAALALAARARRERQAAVARSAAEAALAALAGGHIELAERHIAEGAAADTDHPDVLAAHVKVKEARAAAEAERARRAADAANRERARALEADQQRRADEERRREDEARQRQALDERRHREAEEQRRREAEAEQQRQAAAAARVQQAAAQLRIAEDALARAQPDMALAALDRALEIDPAARVSALRVRAEALRDEQARTEEGRRQREREQRSAATRERIRTIVHSWPVRIAAGVLVLVVAGALILPRLTREGPPASPDPAPAPGTVTAPAAVTVQPPPSAPSPAAEPPNAVAAARGLYGSGQRTAALEALRKNDPRLEGKAERSLAELWLTDARLGVASAAERALRNGARPASSPYRAAASKRGEADKAREAQQLPEALAAYWQAIEMYDALQRGRPDGQPQAVDPAPRDPAPQPASPPAATPSSPPVTSLPGSREAAAVPPVPQPKPADPVPVVPDPQIEREAILRTVYAFAAAMNNRDLAGVQRVRRLSSEEQKLLDDLARNLRSYSYQLTPTGAPTIEGARATLRCLRQQTFVDGSRRKRDQNDTVLVALEKDADRWIIASVTLAR